MLVLFLDFVSATKLRSQRKAIKFGQN